MSRDEDLLKVLSAGGRPGEAFEQLYARYSDAVYRYALVVSQSVSIAEDATQETFVQMIERATDYNAERSPSALGWLYGLLKNNVRKLLRERATGPTFIEDNPLSLSTDRSVELSSAVCSVQSAMAQLDIDHREVLYLVAIQGLDYKTAAQVLGIPLGTVRSRLSRAREALRNLVSESDVIDLVEVTGG